MTIYLGVDEAGRGPLAGDVVAAAVVLDPACRIDGLTDSKKLSAKKRDFLAQAIKQHALSWAIAAATPQEIDDINILQATFLAMTRAIAGIERDFDHILIDGNRCPELPYKMTAIVGGDLTEPCISAASILAKTYRDAQLMALDKVYPQYGFAAHKGYPTKQHMQALAEYGPCPEHRKSYKPVRLHIRPEYS